VVDPDLELRGGGGGEGSVLLALLAFLPSVISFLLKISPPLGPFPYSSTALPNFSWYPFYNKATLSRQDFHFFLHVLNNNNKYFIYPLYI